MREQLIKIFSKIIEWGIILLVFLLPLFFLPITSESFEFPKQILLFLGISFLTIIWVVKMILEKSVKILHSPVTLPVLIFFGVFFISTVFSIHRFSSIFGPYPRLHGGLVSLISYLLTFFLVVANVKERKQITRILFVFCLSGFIVTMIGLANFFDFSILRNLLAGRFLTPAGFSDSAAFFLALLFPILASAFLLEENLILRIVSGFIGFSFLLYIFLINQMIAILAVFLTFLLIIIFSNLKLEKGQAARFGIAFLLCLLLLTINNVGFVKSKIPSLRDRQVQHDLSINPDTAWAITTGGFQSLKILALGSGPGTFLFDFTSFKPPRFNQTSLWDLRFEKSYNEYFQIASTVGLLGLLFFLYILWTIAKISQKIWQKKDFLSQVCLFPVLLFIFISFFSPAITLTNWIFWLFLGLTLSSVYLIKLEGVREVELSLAAIQPQNKPETKGEILPWILGLIVILILLPLLWQEINILRAEIFFAKSQNRQANADVILQSLGRARNLMPAQDNYRRTLSATTLNFALIGQQQKVLTEDAKQQLLQTAVLEGQLATQLDPLNIFNWENLQQVYSVVTVPRQEDLLINNVIPQEILLDPFNPRHYNDRGWLYFNLKNNSEAAKDDFRTAIRLKPDFPDAHYNLARVYKGEGEKDLALTEYEQTLNLLNQQISSLEAIAANRPNIQTTVSQLKQSSDQIRKEKEDLQAQIEAEKAKPPETQPPAEGTPAPPSTTPPPQG